MRNMDSLGLKICSYQAKLFEKSIVKTECSSMIFIRRFMNSNLAIRMDKDGLLFEATDMDNAFDEIDSQYGVSSYGIAKFDAEEMYWIGYIYRYWAYTYEKSSKQIYRMIKPDKLRGLYFPYHSLDPAQAIERIREETGNNEHSLTDISRGVEILRRVRERHEKYGNK